MDRVVALRYSNPSLCSVSSIATRKSNRTPKQKTNQDFIYDELDLDYNLSEGKALQKKLDACRRPTVLAQPKNKGQLRLIFSAAGFEVIREILYDMYIKNPDSDLMKDFSGKHVKARDKNGAIVHERYSIYNKLKSGDTGSRLKFTINLYYTTSSALVNGKFANEIFVATHIPIIEKKLASYQDISALDKKFEKILDSLNSDNDRDATSRNHAYRNLQSASGINDSGKDQICHVTSQTDVPNLVDAHKDNGEEQTKSDNRQTDESCMDSACDNSSTQNIIDSDCQSNARYSIGRDSCTSDIAPQTTSHVVNRQTNESETKNILSKLVQLDESNVNSCGITAVTGTELDHHDGITENQCGVITPAVNHQIDKLHLTDGSSKPDQQNRSDKFRHGDPNSTAEVDTAVNHPQIIDTCEQYPTNTNSNHNEGYVTDGNAYVETEAIPVITHHTLNKKGSIYEPGTHTESINSNDNSDDNSILNTMINEQNLTDESDSVNLPTVLHEQLNIDNELNKEMYHLREDDGSSEPQKKNNNFQTEVQVLCNTIQTNNITEKCQSVTECNLQTASDAGQDKNQHESNTTRSKKLQDDDRQLREREKSIDKREKQLKTRESEVKEYLKQANTTKRYAAKLEDKIIDLETSLGIARQRLLQESNINSQRCPPVEKETQTSSLLEHRSTVQHENQVYQNPGNEFRQSVPEDTLYSAHAFGHRRFQEEATSERKLLNKEIKLIKMKLSRVEDQLRTLLNRPDIESLMQPVPPVTSASPLYSGSLPSTLQTSGPIHQPSIYSAVPGSIQPGIQPHYRNSMIDPFIHPASSVHPQWQPTSYFHQTNMNPAPSCQQTTPSAMLTNQQVPASQLMNMNLTPSHLQQPSRMGLTNPQQDMPRQPVNMNLAPNYPPMTSPKVVTTPSAVLTNQNTRQRMDMNPTSSHIQQLTSSHLQQLPPMVLTNPQQDIPRQPVNMNFAPNYPQLTPPKVVTNPSAVLTNQQDSTRQRIDMNPTSSHLQQLPPMVLTNPQQDISRLPVNMNPAPNHPQMVGKVVMTPSAMLSNQHDSKSQRMNMNFTSCHLKQFPPMVFTNPQHDFTRQHVNMNSGLNSPQMNSSKVVTTPSAVLTIQQDPTSQHMNMKPTSSHLQQSPTMVVTNPQQDIPRQPVNMKYAPNRPQMTAPKVVTTPSATLTNQHDSKSQWMKMSLNSSHLQQFPPMVLTNPQQDIARQPANVNLAPNCLQMTVPKIITNPPQDTLRQPMNMNVAANHPLTIPVVMCAHPQQGTVSQPASMFPAASHPQSSPLTALTNIQQDNPRQPGNSNPTCNQPQISSSMVFFEHQKNSKEHCVNMNLIPSNVALTPQTASFPTVSTNLQEDTSRQSMTKYHDNSRPQMAPSMVSTYSQQDTVRQPVNTLLPANHQQLTPQTEVINNSKQQSMCNVYSSSATSTQRKSHSKLYQSPADLDKDWRNSEKKLNYVSQKIDSNVQQCNGLQPPENSSLQSPTHHHIRSRTFRRSDLPTEDKQQQSFLDSSRELKERWIKQGARPRH